MAEAPAVSLFPSFPARFLFLSIIDILMGIPSGSLCGGESERRVRGDAKAGGWERKESLQRSLQNFHFHPAKTPGTTQSVKTVTANVPQIRKSNNYLSSLDSQGRIEIIDLLACFRNSFPLHQRRMFLTTDWFFFYPLEVELQHAHSNNNSIDSCFVYI